MACVTASIVVKFGEGAVAAGASVQVELGSSEAGFNDGKTSFSPGDTVTLLAYAENVSSLKGYVSAGSIIETTGGTLSITEVVSFARSNEASLRKKAESITSSKWIGASLGAVSLVGSKTVKAATSGTGLLEITYPAKYRRFQVASPAQVGDLKDFDILVVLEAC